MTNEEAEVAIRDLEVRLEEANQEITRLKDQLARVTDDKNEYRKEVVYSNARRGW